MTNVTVSVVENNPVITVTNNSVDVNVTESVVSITDATSGPQGATGATGASGAGYLGVTSVSTITIGSGLKTFTLVSGNQGAFLTGMRVRAIHSDTPTYYMEGTANYIGAGTLIITVDKFNGSGSHNSWAFASAGEVGQTGATGASGVVSVTSPITNTGTSSSAIVGIEQTLLSITTSQVSDFTSGTVTFATTSGTAVYATTSGTAVNISGTVTQAQVSGLTTSLAGKASLGTANTFTVGGHIINSEGASVKPLVIRGNAAQISNLQEWQSTASGTVTVASVTDGGLLTTQNINSLAANIGGGASNGVLSVMPSVSGVGISVRAGGTAQTGNLQEWNNSSGVILSRINSSGNLIVPTVSSSFNISVTAGNATTVPMTVKGTASQSANLQEWQNSGGTALSYVGSAGNFVFPNTSNAIASNQFILGTRNSGAELTMTRQTAATTNPGANLARLYFRDGTTTGTLKLVVRAGAAGAETTILDNIPQ